MTLDDAIQMVEQFSEDCFGQSAASALDDDAGAYNQRRSWLSPQRVMKCLINELNSVIEDGQLDESSFGDPRDEDED